MTLLERAARAACAAAGYDWRTAHDRMMANPDDFPIDEEWMAAVRAVLEAIREPSEGEDRIVAIQRRVMIDELLAGKP